MFLASPGLFAGPLIVANCIELGVSFRIEELGFFSLTKGGITSRAIVVETQALLCRESH